MLLSNQDEPGVAVSFEDGSAAIGGAVVDHDKLEVPKNLP